MEDTKPNCTTSSSSTEKIFKDLHENLKNIWNEMDWTYRLGFISILALCLLLGYGAKLFTYIIGIVFPVYYTIKTIDNNSENTTSLEEENDQRKWLMYWIIYICIEIIETLSGFILHLFPFYHVIKCIFLLWCLSYGRTGIELVYDNLIRRLILNHETYVRESISNASNRLYLLAEDAINLANFNLRSSNTTST